MPLIYDHREERSMIPGLLALQGLDLEARALPVGDYILSDRVAIERKSADDLVESIVDGRLFEQANRLREAYPSSILILVGQPERFPIESWQGALASVLRQGVSVLPVADIAEAADWIVRLHRQEGRGASGPRGQTRKPKDPDRLSSFILSSLPGVGHKRAEALLAHFGSLAAVFAADGPAIAEVDGFGKKKANDLAELFTRRWAATPFAEDQGT